MPRGYPEKRRYAPNVATYLIVIGRLESRMTRAATARIPYIAPVRSGGPMFAYEGLDHNMLTISSQRIHQLATDSGIYPELFEKDKGKLTPVPSAHKASQEFLQVFELAASRLTPTGAVGPETRQFEREVLLWFIYWLKYAINNFGERAGYLITTPQRATDLASWMRRSKRATSDVQDIIQEDDARDPQRKE